jgi:patatin-like phospholipase/acyl hydrolase
MEKIILSIDGGGMRGIVSAILLQSLEEMLQKYSNNPKARIGDYFDLVAGTSTGSILTVLYLYPNERGESKYSAQEVTQAYIDYGNYIFKRQFFYPFWGAKYTNKYLEEMLVEYFHEDTLGNLRKPCLLTSYDITQRKAVFFNSVTGRADQQRNYLLKDAILASTAAPTFFPPTCKKERNSCYGCLVDGGVVANNPALCALIEALKLPDCKRLNQIVTVSVGNAKNTKSYSYQKAKFWGLFQWALPMFDVLMDGSEQTVDYQLRRLYKSINQPQDYMRFLLHTDESVPKMDECSSDAIKRFQDLGKRLADREKAQIEVLAKRLTHHI